MRSHVQDAIFDCKVLIVKVKQDTRVSGDEKRPRRQAIASRMVQTLLLLATIAYRYRDTKHRIGPDVLATMALYAIGCSDIHNQAMCIDCD